MSVVTFKISENMADFDSRRAELEPLSKEELLDKLLFTESDLKVEKMKTEQSEMLLAVQAVDLHLKLDTSIVDVSDPEYLESVESK